MIRGIYTAAAGLATAQLRLGIVSNNVANASTPGYKQDQLHGRRIGQRHTREEACARDETQDAAYGSLRPLPSEGQNHFEQLGVFGVDPTYLPRHWVGRAVRVRHGRCPQAALAR